MSTSIKLLTIAILSYFTVGTLNHDANILLWLASDSLGFQILRIGLTTILVVLLLTKPPRNTIFRIATGFIAGITACYSLYGFYNYAIEFGDCVSLLLASIVIGVAALESSLAVSKARFATSSQESLLHSIRTLPGGFRSTCGTKRMLNGRIMC